MLRNSIFKEIQKQLGLKRYEPVWAMAHKLRKVMKNRDECYTPQDMIELNKGYFTVKVSEIEKDNNKRSYGTIGRQNVAIMAESVPLENLKTGKIVSLF